LGSIADFVAVNRQVSRGELDQLAELIMTVVESREDFTNISLNYERGVITIALAGADGIPSLRDELAADVGIEAVIGREAEKLDVLFDFTIAGSDPQVAIVQGSRFEALDSQTVAPLKGGKAVTTRFVYSGTEFIRNCSAGFLVVGGGGGYMMTAGHCGPANSQVFLGENGQGLAQGPLQNNTFWHVPSPSADAAVFLVGSSGADASVYYDDDYSRPVVAQATATAPAGTLYSYACTIGKTTGSEKCGWITGVNESGTMDLAGWKPDYMNHVLTGMIRWQSNSNPGCQGGDSGGPLYGVNPDGTAVALGILSAEGGTACYFSRIGAALSQTATSLSANGRSPFGWFDLAEGGSGTVRVRGWALDPDLAREAIYVHVYVGGVSGSGEGHSFLADGYRPDVQTVYPNTGEYHGFDVTFSTSRRGNVPVYVYAINADGSVSNNSLIDGNPITVYVS
jgi:hypothetical protein